MRRKGLVIAETLPKSAQMGQDGIILLHGIARTARSMRGLEKYLAKQGFATLNITYPSLKKSIEDIGDIIHSAIEEFASKIDGQLHFVGYSMGGLVIRAYLHRHQPERLGRVIMLGTPNQGSEIADLIRNWRVYKRFGGPAAQQLLTQQDAFRHIFGEVTFAPGIIAGVTRLDPLTAMIIKQPNDGIVSVASTRLPGMADHIVISGMHRYLPRNRRAWRQILHFLQHGTFKTDNPSTAPAPPDADPASGPATG